jgi:hypothetical protein
MIQFMLGFVIVCLFVPCAMAVLVALFSGGLWTLYGIGKLGNAMSSPERPVASEWTEYNRICREGVNGKTPSFFQLWKAMPWW